MKPGDMIQLLTSWNPWWQNATTWTATDVQLSAAASSGYDYTPQVLGDIPTGALVLLRGPRRVGKSVELKRYVQGRLDDGVAPRSIIHAAVDGWKASDLRSLVEAGKKLAPPRTERRWWLIDEISGVSGWDAQIKNLRDNDLEFKNDTVVLTGSSARDLTAATSSLAGRRGEVERPDRTLLPMGFRSFANIMMGAYNKTLPTTDALPAHQLRSPLAAQLLNDLLPWLSELRDWWEIYLNVGGFPQAVSAHLSGKSSGPVVQALFDVIQRDLLGTSTLTEQQVTALLARITQGLASPMNISNVAADTDLTADTVNRRLEDLVAGFNAWPCPLGVKQRPQLKSQAKRYFTDPLLARLAHSRSPIYHSPDHTQLTEQQLGMALLRTAEAQLPGAFASFDRVLYERTPTRKEIDFTGAVLGDVALEGKYTDGGKWVGESATVNASSYAGVLATRSVLDTSAADASEAWAIPAGMLAYCIDT